jgi:hypothetical protein
MNPAQRPHFLTVNTRDNDALAHLLLRQNNVISRRQAVRMLSPAAVRQRLSSGRWQVAHRGVYFASSEPFMFADENQRRWVASLSAGGGRAAPVGGLTALAVLGLRGFTEHDIHVVLPEVKRHRRPPIFAVVHRCVDLTREHVHWSAAPPCTRAARSVVDAARWTRFDDRARAVIAAAHQQRLVRGDDIEREVDAMPRMRRRGLIVEAARDARGGVHSLPEAEFVRLCRDAGFPRPSCQVVRDDSNGQRRYLDAVFDSWQVHVEIDGGQHMEVRQWWADMKRQNDLWVSGGRVLRFPSWAIRHRPTEVVAQLRAALTAAGWRG